MVALAEKPTPAMLEADARSVWSGQRLPPSEGPVGPPDGPVVRQFLGAFAAQETGTLVAQRAVAADVDARAMMLAGRRAQGSLRLEDGGPPIASPRLAPVLGALGVWVGGAGGRPWDSDPRRPAVQRLVGRLAHAGALAVRDVSLRICPACGIARSPERIVYQEEDGETLLVRFRFPDGDRTVSALVWSDAAWRLLGASALMVHPDLPYVIARYRRRGAEELVFTSKSSLERIRGWLPGAELEVLEEHPGRHWEGRVYDHPLRHEFPMGGELEPPCGTIVPVPDVSDTGTGVVPLIPGHGGTDTQIADRLRLPGWPLITPKGRFDILFVHKYAGLELDSGNEFVSRDLEEGGAIFARLRVRRGVPHCARCGTPMIWAPGRAWCLEPSRLPPEKVALYRSLLPRDRPIERLEVVPWPVSEPQRSDDPLAVALLECSACDRLDAIENAAAPCACGGRRRTIRRRLLSAFDAAASAWAAVDPFAPSDAARLYVNERRRAPALVHHIAAMSGVAGNVGDVRLTILPTVPEEDLPALTARYGADAVRAAFVRSEGSEGATATFEERCAQEARRLEWFWRTARRILLPIDSAALVTYAQPIAGALGELLPEDRALLARFERMRIQATVDYDRSAAHLVHRRLFAFLENDLSEYLAWVASRLAEPGSPPSRRSATHTLVHVLFGTTQLLGPIAPFVAESVHRALRRSRASLFQEPAVGVDRTLLDPTRAKSWDRWLSVVRSTDRFRRSVGVPPGAELPSAALIVDSDPVADELRADAPTIERLARVGKIEVGSPGAPWPGRRRQLKPREAEIQRVYASRAAQIMHLLRRMPERKATDALSGQGFSMMVNGQPTQILPSMVEWEETLPDRFVPVGWSAGEMYASIPAGVPLPTDPPPPLSRDGLVVVARLRQRLRNAPRGSTRAVVVAAPAALAAELRPVLGPIARHLGVAEVRLTGAESELPRHGRGSGRTRAGTRWSFHVSDLDGVARAAKRRPVRAHGARVRPAFAPGDLLPSNRDYADPEWIGREVAVRALGQELDELLGSPLLGPAKVSTGWDAGLRDVQAYRSADWTSLVALPGFGRPVASALVSRFGGAVPPPPSTAERRAALGVTSRSRGPAPPTPPSYPPELPARESPVAPPTPTVIPRPVRPAETIVTRPPSPSLPAAPPTAPEQSSELPVSVPPEENTPVSDGELPELSTPEAPLPAGESPSEGMADPADIGTEGPVAPSPSDAPIFEDPSPAPEPPESTSTPGAAEDANEPAEPSVASSRGLEPAAPGDGEPASSAESELLAALEPPVAPSEAPAPPAPDSGDSPSTVPAETIGEPTSAIAPSSGLEAELGSPRDEAESRLTGTADANEAPPRSEPTLELSGPEAVPEPALPPSLEPPAPPPDSPGPVSPPLTPPEPVLPPVAPAPPVPPGPTPSPPVVDTLGVPSLDAAVEPVPPPSPVAPTPAAGVDLTVGPSYLPSLERFLEATAAGHQGICIVRDSPERIRAYVGSRPVEIRWLTNIGRGPTLKPTDLDGLSAFLAHAVSTGHVTAFFLEGVEYLVRLHGLEKVVERMVAFDQLAREHAARVWLPLNPKLLSTPELDRFVAAFGATAAAG